MPTPCSGPQGTSALAGPELPHAPGLHLGSSWHTLSSPEQCQSCSCLSLGRILGLFHLMMAGSSVWGRPGAPLPAAGLWDLSPAGCAVLCHSPAGDVATRLGLGGAWQARAQRFSQLLSQEGIGAMRAAREASRPAAEPWGRGLFFPHLSPAIQPASEIPGEPGSVGSGGLRGRRPADTEQPCVLSIQLQPGARLPPCRPPARRGVGALPWLFRGGLSTKGCPRGPISAPSVPAGPGGAGEMLHGADAPSKTEGCTEIALAFSADLCLGINVCFVHFKAL